MTEKHEDGELTVTKVSDLGPYSNNAYIIADGRANQALIVDMPADSRRVLDAVHGLHVIGILLTHTHPDHWADYSLVTGATGAPVICHPAETIMPADKIDRPLSDGEEIVIGNLAVHAIHTPGHTPGSTCYRAGRFLLSGDVLFPGGPGRTQTPEDLQQSIASITKRLHTLPDETPVFPGHGGDTTIGDSKREYAGFAARSHPPGLSGDVTWAG